MGTDAAFIGPNELAARWHLDRKTILGAVQRGEIPATRIGQLWRIPTAWVVERVSPPPPPPPPPRRRRVHTRRHAA